MTNIFKIFAGSLLVASLTFVGGRVFAQTTQPTPVVTSAYPAGTNICGTNVGPWYPGMALPSQYAGCVNGSASGATAVNNSSSTPGAPNTGAGGNTASNLAILAASALVAVAGATYATRTARA